MQRDRYMTDIQIDPYTDLISVVLVSYPTDDFMEIMTDKGYTLWSSVCPSSTNICATWQTVDGSYRQFVLPIYEREGNVYFSHNESILLEVVSQLIKDNVELTHKVDMYKSILNDALKPKEVNDAEAD